MVRRLIIDFLWRARGVPLALLILGCATTLAGRIPTDVMVALSMTAAFCAGPLMVDHLITREVFLLPVSGRQLWRARWWVTTVGAVIVIAIPKTAAIGRHGISFFLLSMLCDLAYVGVAPALWPLFNTQPRGPVWFRRAAIRLGMILWLLTLGGGAVVWPFVMRASLPTEWGHLAGPSGLVLGVALVLTVIGYRHTPAPGAPRNLMRGRGETNPVRPSGLAAARIPERLTGVSYVLMRDAQVSFAYAALVIGTLLVLGVLPDPADGLSAHITYAADSVVPGTGEFFGRSLWLMLLFSCCPGGVQWQRVLRHARTLPLSTTQLIALLVAVPLMRWLAVWLVLALLFVLDGRAPRPFAADTLLAFTAIPALMHAVGLGMNHSRTTTVLGVMFVGLVTVTLSLRFFAGIEEVAAALRLSMTALVGLVVLAAAVLLHYHTLTRRSATYRRPAAGYGVPVQGRA